MISEIPKLPDHVAGFMGTGYITALDYESVLIPTVEDKLERHDKVNFLYHLPEEFCGFEAGALWDDAKVGLTHRSEWGKVAMVCDVPWMERAVKVAAFLIKGEVKLFSTDHYHDAVAWVSD
ncbi:STAS/SEC14 domain-containing protein [Porticoccaceae bacterium LTM1]|nr:STAS/SEC14 domain-containing protein [Porticoccaceae bacterium LTM1]